MGTFHVVCSIENHVARSRSARVSRVLVDTGSDYTWLPAAVLQKIGVTPEKRDLTFTMANGANDHAQCRIRDYPRRGRIHD